MDDVRAVGRSTGMRRVSSQTSDCRGFVSALMWELAQCRAANRKRWISW